MPKAILNLRDMKEKSVKDTESKKLLNMYLIYKIGLPGLPLSYAIPWWSVDDLNQIKEDTYMIASWAENLGTTVMVRSAHYREKDGKELPEVSMPYRVDQRTADEIYRSIVDVLNESREIVKKSSIDVYKPNVIICTSLNECYKSGMIHVHEDAFEVHSLYGNVVAMLRHDYPHDTILVDRSFNVLDKISRKKERMMNFHSGKVIVEDVPLDKQDKLSISDLELPLFISHIRLIAKNSRNMEAEAMWLQGTNDEIYYSYLDFMEPSHKTAKRIVLDKKPVTYFDGINLSRLKERTVYVPANILEDKEKADNAITFIACSGAKAVLLPKQISQCSHRLKVLREMGVYCEAIE